MLNLKQQGARRITRRKYLMAFLIYLGLAVVGYMLLESAPPLGFLMSVGAIVYWYVAMLERAHDCGYSWGYLFIPFFNIWLFVAPGDEGDNFYGPDPRMPVVNDDK